MFESGQERRGQPRPHIHSFPVCLQIGRKFKTLLCVAKCQKATLQALMRSLTAFLAERNSTRDPALVEAVE
jgi:hypothetical protein